MAKMLFAVPPFNAWPKAMFTVARGIAPGRNATPQSDWPKAIVTCSILYSREPTMPQSFTKLYAHLIFSTKNRKPFLDDPIRPRVHAYLATALRDLDSPFVVAGGVADHVHVLFDMGKMHAPVKIVEQVKRESSKFVKTLGSRYKNFYWQRGYALFSVGPTQRSDVEAYVRNQEEHHRKITFQDELRMFLKRYEMDYDERYVWD
jgi:REP element-mobilizing transposase RayT